MLFPPFYKGGKPVRLKTVARTSDHVLVLGRTEEGDYEGAETGDAVVVALKMPGLELVREEWFEARNYYCEFHQKFICHQVERFSCEVFLQKSLQKGRDCTGNVFHCK